MVWKIKNNRNDYDSRIHVGFALFPLRLANIDYMIWLESYFYYQIMYSEDGPVETKRFRNIRDAKESLECDLDKNEYII